MYPTHTPKVTRPYGVPGDYAAGFHTGTDFGWTRPIEIIRNTFRGTVVRVGYDADGYGKFVVVRCRTLRHGTRYAWYCHLDSHNNLRVGRYLRSGAIIGVMGSTGNAFGRHLHYEERVGQNRYGVDARKPILLKARTVSRSLKRQGWK